MSRQSDIVHLAARHPSTKKFGTLATPLEQVSTACRGKWTERPRRTLLPKLVTCDACKLYIAAHKLPENWAFA